VGQAAQGCDHWCTLHNDRHYPYPTWEATMSCLTKTCCDKKLDTTHLRKEAASFAESVVDQAEKAALWAAPHVSKQHPVNAYWVAVLILLLNMLQNVIAAMLLTGACYRS